MIDQNKRVYGRGSPLSAEYARSAYPERCEGMESYILPSGEVGYRPTISAKFPADIGVEGVPVSMREPAPPTTAKFGFRRSLHGPIRDVS